MSARRYLKQAFHEATFMEGAQTPCAKFLFNAIDKALQMPPVPVPSVVPATRRHDHATSKAAAESVYKASGKIALAVLSFARQHPDGFTDDDLKVAFSDAPESSYRKRRSELTKHGYLIDTGMARPNRHGRDETMWMITDKGRSVQ